MHIRDHHVGIDHQTDLKRSFSEFLDAKQMDRTYVEDLKESGKVPVPPSDLALITLGKDESM